MSSGKSIDIEGWIAERTDALARWDQTRFIRDVFVEPSIGPVAGWLISGVVTLVAWLTQQYAPGAFERAADGVQGEVGGIIPISRGYWTLGAVGVITMMAAMQPIIAKQFVIQFAGPLEKYRRLNIALRVPVDLARLTLRTVYLVPAWAFSAADYLLARPAALLAGTGFRQAWLRYGTFLLWMTAAGVSAWLLPSPFGLQAAAVGAILIVGVVRRWQWIEEDRTAFASAPQLERDGNWAALNEDLRILMRVGLRQDLRVEALVALLFLFALLPLGLRQIDQGWPDTFTIAGENDDHASVLAWFGFFGAEVAKSVPFVDWSEVFHVANGSPIEPHTGVGALVVFVLRATIDLIMLSAVVGSIQMSGRVAEYDRRQKSRYNMRIIDRLEERAEKHELVRAIRVCRTKLALDSADAFDLSRLATPEVIDFRRYNEERLQELYYTTPRWDVRNFIGLVIEQKGVNSVPAIGTM